MDFLHLPALAKALPLTISPPYTPSFVKLLSCAVISFIYIALLAPSKSRQHLVPSVPIIGVTKKNFSSIKRARKRFITDARNMLLDGYHKAKGGFYYVPSPAGERLMIPTTYLEELKNAPIDKVDFVATFQEMFEGKYTTMGSRSTLHPRVVKAQVNQNLDSIMPAIEEEVRESINSLLPECIDWTEVPIFHVLTRTVAQVSSRMFGGTDLSRNEGWLDTMIHFAEDGFAGAQSIKKYPSPLRPLVYRFLPAIRKIGEHYNFADRLITPILGQRQEIQDKPKDFLQWMSENAVGDEKDKKFMSAIQLKLSFAAIHTTASAQTQLLYDLCARPEYIKPLRDEIAEALAQEGSLTKKAFAKMPKMDSFLKESQRFSPLLLVTFERYVHEDWSLSDGFVIPGSTTIGVPAHAIGMDPDLFPDPATFDGFRFSKVRESEVEKAGRVQYASCNQQSLAFGYGRHACPGRFFAANEIKAIAAHLLMNYDIKFKEGQERPASTVVETQYLPDPNTRILMKKRGI